MCSLLPGFCSRDLPGKPAKKLPVQAADAMSMVSTQTGNNVCFVKRFYIIANFLWL